MVIATIRHATLLATALLLLSGCGGGGGVLSEQATPVGTRLALPAEAQALGESSCTFYKAEEQQGMERFEIRCPGWEQAVGQVWRGASPVGQWQERLIREGRLVTSLQQEALCDPAEASALLDERPALLRYCRSRDGALPYLLVTSDIERNAFVLWGPPHLVPLFEAFIRLSLQGSAVEIRPGTRSQLIALAEQAIAPEGRPIGLEDMGHFLALDGLSTLYNSAGDYPQALESARQALALHERLKGPDHPDGGYLLARIARELSRQQPAAADSLFQRAEPLVQRSQDPADWPEFLVYRAWHALTQGDSEQALADARHSWELSRSLAAGERHNPRLGHSLIGVGDVYRQLEQWEEAEAAYRQALEIFSALRSGDYHWAGKSHQRLAQLYVQQQRLDPARHHASEAVAIAQRLFGEGQALVEALVTQAEVEQATNQPQLALPHWREVRRILQANPTLLTQLPPELFEGYLTLLFQQSQHADSESASALHEEAFQIAQLGQTPAAGRAITQVAARLADSNPEIREQVRLLQDTQRQRQDLHYTLGLERGRPSAERNLQHEQTLYQQLQAAQQHYREQEQQLQTRFPRYGRLITPNPLSSSEVAHLLRPGEALLRILPGRHQSWLFLITDDGQLHAATSESITPQIAWQVARLRHGVDASSGRIPRFNLALAQQLYQQLLGPLDSALDPVRHLLFVPSGPLLSLPPALLLRTPPDHPSDYTKAHWLVRDMAFTTLPSVVALAQFREVSRPSQAPYPFLGLGNPDFRGDQREAERPLQAQLPGCEIDAAAIAQLTPLPETANELRTLARILGADPQQSLLLGEAATLPALQQRELHRYRILAFATHALLPGELNCLSEAALALTPRWEESDNGLLDVAAVTELHLDADWVLLSACNTAGGGSSELRGEGLSGLATAFFYAGSRALLASHWYVVSAATVQLTTDTFANHQANPQQGRAEALRQAQLTLLNQRETAHPLFWAAFTLIGDTGDWLP